MAIDLHIHTTASDGSLTPGQVVEKAKARALTVIAITDHDTVSGVTEGLEQGILLGIEVVPAMEISTEEEGEEVHILGYFIDYAAPWLKGLMKELKEKREERINKILEKLNKFKIEIDLKEVKEVAQEGTLGRPHVAQALARKGYVRSVAEAFEKYLGNDAPAYVPRGHITPVEAIEVVHEAGGLAVLAHPAIFKDQSRLNQMLKLGIEGIECWHSEQARAVSNRYIKFATEHGLLMTGGSDYHGAYFDPHRRLGRPTVPDRIYEDLLRCWLGKGKEESGIPKSNFIN